MTDILYNNDTVTQLLIHFPALSAAVAIQSYHVLKILKDYDYRSLHKRQWTISDLLPFTLHTLYSIILIMTPRLYEGCGRQPYHRSRTGRNRKVHLSRIFRRTQHGYDCRWAGTWRYPYRCRRQKANSKEAYDEIADEIFRLREFRQQTTVELKSGLSIDMPAWKIMWEKKIRKKDKPPVYRVMGFTWYAGGVFAL